MAAPQTTAAISHIRRAHETRHRSTGRDLSSCDNHSYISARRPRARDAGEFMQRATPTAPVTRDARTLGTRHKTNTRAKPEAPQSTIVLTQTCADTRTQARESAKKAARHGFLDPVTTHDRASTHTRHETNT